MQNTHTHTRTYINIKIITFPEITTKYFIYHLFFVLSTTLKILLKLVVTWKNVFFFKLKYDLFLNPKPKFHIDRTQVIGQRLVMEQAECHFMSEDSTTNELRVYYMCINQNRNKNYPFLELSLTFAVSPSAAQSTSFA